MTHFEPAGAGSQSSSQSTSPRQRCCSDFLDDRAASKWEHPPSFYCPISQQCMHDPVVVADGHSYERQYIERWLQEQETSPVTGVNLAQKHIFPNHALRNAIDEYFQQIFSVHRQKISHTLESLETKQCLGANSSLLRAIDALMQCSLLMNADLSTDSVLRRIMDEARTLVGADVASFFLLDASAQELVTTVNSNGLHIRIPMTAGIAGHVATSGEPVVINDAYSDPRFNKACDAKNKFRTRNMICVPLKVKSGDVIGVVQLINKAIDESLFRGAGQSAEEGSADFTAKDLQFLLVFASQAATAIASSGMHQSETAQPQHAAEPSPSQPPDAAVEKKSADPKQDSSRQKKSGRARQRAARFRYQMRRIRTPSPEMGHVHTYATEYSSVSSGFLQHQHSTLHVGHILARIRALSRTA